MQSWSSRIAISGLAVLTLASAAAAVFLLFADPVGYQGRIIATLRQQAGIGMTVTEPPHWQLWPPGLHLGRLALTDAASHAPLLEAAAADIGIAPASLFTGAPRLDSIALQGADILYRHAAGRSNWSALLARLPDRGDGLPARLMLRDSALIVTDGEGRENARFDIASSRLEMPAQGPWPLTAQFNFTRQGRHGNLLAQSTLDAQLQRRGARGVTLSRSVLSGTVSSVLFPGELAFTARGDLDAGAGRLTATRLSVDGSYKNIAMQAAVPFHLTTPLQLDDGSLLLPAWQLTAGGTTTAPAIIATATVRMGWGQGPLRFVLQDGQLRDGAFDVQAFAVDARAAGGKLTVSRASARIGDGRIDLPLEVDASGDVPRAVLRPDVRDIELSRVAPLLGGDAAWQGRLSMHGQLTGNGYTPRDWLGAAAGTLRVEVRDGRVGDSGRLLHEKLVDHHSFLPPLADPVPADQGRLQLTIDNTFKAGVVHSDADIVMEYARLRGGGEFDAVRHTMHYRTTLTLDKALFAAPAQAVTLPVECSGNPREEQLTFLEALNADCGVPDDYKQKMLARVLQQRFLGH